MGEGRIGDLQFFLNLADHESFGMGGEQQLHDSESGLGAYGGEHVGVFGDPLCGLAGGWGFSGHWHISILLEIWIMSRIKIATRCERRLQCANLGRLSGILCRSEY